ncbi:Conserved_hypothetical protein [Hexamita inflata]|uniref:Uncharacterized protein n=1 Tax=Hexamita inflata TaxID=28002 RepID=A0AA86UAB4_9EUKA|nr:Conserved hypothetical protein [Hexamita inflata]
MGSTSNSCIIKEEKFDSIRPEQLINVLKIDPYNNIYLSLKYNKIRVVDSDYNVLKELSLNLPHRKSDNYKEVKEETPQLLQLIICQGIIYFQYFQYVISYENAQLKILFEIPMLKRNDCFAFYGRLFSLNNQLFVSNKHSIYVLENDKLKLVKQMGGNFFQFCEKVFVWNYSLQTISLLKNDLTEEIITKTFDKSYDVQLASGGILVVKSITRNNYTIVDMVNAKSVVVKHTKQFNAFYIQQYLSLGSSGIQLSNGTLRKLFGTNYPQQVKSCYQKYIIDQMQFPSYKATFKQILSSEQYLQLLKAELIFKSRNTSQHCKKVISETKTKMQQVNNSLQTYLDTQSFLVQRFVVSVQMEESL